MIGHNPKANQPDLLAEDFQDVAALLRELPRVAAPTDFNASLQARIASAKAEANDFAGVTSLLKELPRVAAPVDFNARLQARIAATKSEAPEFADVLTLVKELPRVAAPADFDFKLRARIAQAKAEQQKASAGWFAEWFGRTFSWVQASAALAAVAIVVSVVSFGVLRSEKNTPSSSATTIARGVIPTPSVALEQTPTVSNDPQPKITQAPAMNVRSIAAVRPKTINAVSRPATPIINTERMVPATTTPSTLVATKVMIKHQSGEARMVNLSEYNLGLQTAHLRSTPAAPRTVQTAMANIY